MYSRTTAPILGEVQNFSNGNAGDPATVIAAVASGAGASINTTELTTMGLSAAVQSASSTSAITESGAITAANAAATAVNDEDIELRTININGTAQSESGTSPTAEATDDVANDESTPDSNTIELMTINLGAASAGRGAASSWEITSNNDDTNGTRVTEETNNQFYNISMEVQESLLNSIRSLVNTNNLISTQGISSIQGFLDGLNDRPENNTSLRDQVNILAGQPNENQSSAFAFFIRAVDQAFLYIQEISRILEVDSRQEAVVDRRTTVVHFIQSIVNNSTDFFNDIEYCISSGNQIYQAAGYVGQQWYD